MQVKLGPLVSDAAGSIGGSTFQRSFIATQVRVKPLPTRRRTRATNPRRGLMGQLARTWRTLSDSDRTKWQIEADLLTWTNRFGDVIRGKGYWLYIRCNQYLQLCGAAIRSVPDAQFAITAITGLAATGSVATTMSIAWSAPSGTQASTTWLVLASRPMSAGRSAPFGALRLLTTFAAATTTPQNVGSLYNSLFGTSQKVGDRTFVLCLPINNRGGYPGVPVQTSFVWT